MGRNCGAVYGEAPNDAKKGTQLAMSPDGRRQVLPRHLPRHLPLHMTRHLKHCIPPHLELSAAVPGPLAAGLATSPATSSDTVYILGY